MSNLPKDHPSFRAHAAPSGQSNNNFATSEFEQSAANKKKHMGSDIFGSSKDNTDTAPVAKQTRNTGNNIFGNGREETNTDAGTLAGQYKQTQMKSNIFGTDEPASTRNASDKNKSNIFGIGDNDEQNKRQTQVRQGLRGGYNPINGEAYSAKDNVNSKNNEDEKQSDTSVKTTEEENGNAQVAPANDKAQEATPANGNAQKAVEKPDNTSNENNGQKNVHTSVRVFHPPGGKSNGPLW